MKNIVEKKFYLKKLFVPLAETYRYRKIAFLNYSLQSLMIQFPGIAESFRHAYFSVPKELIRFL